MVVMKQEGTAEAALDVVNGTVDGTTKTIVCFCCLLVSCTEMAEGKWHIEHYFIKSRRKD
jgi:hypothetical protein